MVPNSSCAPDQRSDVFRCLFGCRENGVSSGYYAIRHLASSLVLVLLFTADGLVIRHVWYAGSCIRPLGGYSRPSGGGYLAMIDQVRLGTRRTHLSYPYTVIETGPVM